MKYWDLSEKSWSMTLYWKRIEYQSYVVPSSLPKAGIIFFAISSFCKHILASVRTESAYKVIFDIELFVQKIMYIYFCFACYKANLISQYLHLCCWFERTFYGIRGNCFNYIFSRSQVFTINSFLCLRFFRFSGTLWKNQNEDFPIEYL